MCDKPIFSHVFNILHVHVQKEAMADFDLFFSFLFHSWKSDYLNLLLRADNSKVWMTHIRHWNGTGLHLVRVGEGNPLVV